MKQKALRAITILAAFAVTMTLALMLGTISSFSFAQPSETNDKSLEADHEHILKRINEVAPTCTKPGYVEYFVCTICEKKFSDPDAANEISKPDTIPALGTAHSWGKWKIKKNPTKSRKGVLITKCSKCGESKTKTIAKLKTKNKGKFKGTKKTIQADTSSKKVYFILFRLKPTRKYKSNDKLIFTVKGTDFTGKRIFTDKDSGTYSKSWKSGYFYYTPETTFKPGRYKVTFASKKGRAYKVTYKIQKYSSYVTSIDASKTLTSINGWDWLDIWDKYPSNGLLWGRAKSSNPKVISVHYDFEKKKFYIVGHKRPGKATITITLPNKKKFRIKTQIYTPFLEWNSYNLYIGQKFKDTFYNYVGKVKYWSSNPRVAKVTQKGKVKAVGYGTCYIYAKGGKWKDKTKVISSYRNPRKGMTKSQVLRTSWGKPDRRNNYGNGLIQWVWEWDDETDYVYFRNGRVSLIQKFNY